MKLDPDCIRGILLTVEDVCDSNTVWQYQRDTFESEYLAEYSHNVILYHIYQCEYSDLIRDVTYSEDGDIVSIGDLTPHGHQFLADIRSDTVWNGVKGIARKVGSTSLSALVQIASNVIAERIKAEFGLSN